MVRDVEHLARVVKAGGVVVYPTETLYALGCLAVDPAAAARVAAIKGRPVAKPLPVVIGAMDQLGLVVADPGDESVKALSGAFWPGPLSLVAPAAGGLAPQAMDGWGMVSVRLTPHPLAAWLCRECGPLVATSANKSGYAPAARPGDLDPEVVAGADAAWLEPPLPGGGAPSTVVRLGPGRSLALLRQGAVAAQALIRSGFSLESA